MNRRRRARSWRVFDPRERAVIHAQLLDSVAATCPRCRTCLEAQPVTRLAAVLPSGAGGYDLDCRRCRRFYARVTLSEQARYHLRIRRLARAILRA